MAQSLKHRLDCLRKRTEPLDSERVERIHAICINSKCIGRSFEQKWIKKAKSLKNLMAAEKKGSFPVIEMGSSPMRRYVSPYFCNKMLD